MDGVAWNNFESHRCCTRFPASQLDIAKDQDSDILSGQAVGQVCLKLHQSDTPGLISLIQRLQRQRPYRSHVYNVAGSFEMKVWITLLGHNAESDIAITC